MPDLTIRDCLDNADGLIYDWKRYWYKAGSTSRSTSGFLKVYRIGAEIITSPDVVAFEQISQTPCLILLGESGMGKSHAICSEYVAVASKNNEALFFKLGFLGSETTLYNDLFQSKKFLAWIHGSHHLHLFLDGLDECQSRIRTVGGRILTELKEHRDKLERLSLRIVCRTGDWSKELEQGLINLWKAEAVGVYELAQLTVENVKLAVSQNNLDPTSFLQEIAQKEIVPLAARPVTLKMLLAEYQESDGHLPSNQADLYLKGCLRLCRERTESWQQIRQLDEYQCVAVAARIAAVSMFSGRPITWKGLDLDAISNKDAIVTVEDLIGGKEYYDRNSFQNEVSVDNDAIRETLSRGLFSRYSADAVVWTHLSYAEFLAAWYLKHQKLPLPQVKSLLFHAGRLVPQLHSAASWVVGMIPEVFQEIVNADPEVLLKGNANTDSDADRANLAASLLNLCDEEKIVWRDLPISTYGKKLSHPNLAGQLKPYICDKTKNEDVRSLAINIAEACELKDLQEEVVAVAIDTSQPIRVRIEAAEAACKIADSTTKTRLRSLITEEVEDDFDQLKGWAFQAVWPDDLSARDLFDLIQFPKRYNPYGKYELFLIHEIAPQLQPEDLPVALEWVEKQQIWFKEQFKRTESGEGSRSLPSSFRKLMNSIILKAAEHFTHPEILEPLARTVLRSVTEYRQVSGDKVDELFKSEAWQDNSKRHQIVVAIVNCLANPEATVGEVFYNKLVHLTPLVPREDFVWLLECLQAAEASQQEVWIKLLAKRFNSQNREHVERLLVLIESEQIPALREAFSSYIDPIELGSTKAQSERKYYLELQKIEIEDAISLGRDVTPLSESDREFLRQFSDFEDDEIETQSKQNLTFSVQELNQKLLQLLDEFEAGDLDAWWIINYWMAVKPDTNELHEYKADLSSLPLWQDLELSTQERILEIAAKYIQENKPGLENWLNSRFRPASAGYRAFYLLLKQQPDQISEIPKETWQLWSSIILDYSNNFIDDNKDTHHKLIELTYKNAPDETIQSVLNLLEKQDKEFGMTRIIDSLDKFWDKPLLDAILKKLQETDFSLQTIRDLLKTLVQKNSEEGILAIKQCIDTWSISTEEKTSSLEEFSKLLITFNNQTANVIPELFPLFQIQLKLFLAYLKRWQEPIISASTLLSYSQDAGWVFLWNLFQHYATFGQAVVEDAVQSNDVFSNIGSALSETQLTDFFVWLTQQYPFDEDPKHSDVYSPETRDYIAKLKSTVLHYLQEKGTLQAVLEVQRIKNTFPELAWLNSILLATQAKTRSQTWSRPSPKDILELAKNPRVRFIRNGDELLNLVYESLERLENSLQDNETLPVFDLWNKFTPGVLAKLVLLALKPLYQLSSDLKKNKKNIESEVNDLFKEKVYIPVGEDDLSSYIKRYLDSEIKALGVVVSREVEINRKDYVDLRIDCMTKNNNGFIESYCVIIEVKGTWNKELNISMKDQLLKRYLSDVSCQHGIYLVGWFNCDKWSQQDYRKADAQSSTKNFSTLEEAKKHFTNQAKNLSQSTKQVKAFVMNVSLP